MIKVSVIIPVYGVEKYIERCARSLFGQTLDSLEFIFVDDCSPDRSVEILQALVEEYRERLEAQNSVVRIEHMEVNGGQAAARRRGMELARGEYVIHCDSDDWVLPQTYALLYAKAVTEGADVVICDHLVHNGKEVLARKKGIYRGTDPEVFLVDAARDRANWSLCDKLVRRECLKNVVLYPKFNMGEDLVITFQILSAQPRVAYVDEALYCYFVNTGSITKHVTRKIALNNYNQLLGNVDTVKEALVRTGRYEHYRQLVDCLYYRTLNILIKFIPDRDIYRTWRKCVKDLHLDVMRNPYIKGHYKSRHILLMMHLNFLFIRKHME